jgi:hypothetical protein
MLLDHITIKHVDKLSDPDPADVEASGAGNMAAASEAGQ